jgi:hypothetical protein
MTFVAGFIAGCVVGAVARFGVLAVLIVGAGTR